MRIGPVDVRSLARMAPKAGITNAPFRLIVKECGSGLTTTEEMDATALLLEHPHPNDLAADYPEPRPPAPESPAAYPPEERPLAMQLLGKAPDTLRRAAEKCQRLGADIVDLNM